MRQLRAWFVRLGATLRPGHRDRELADELNGHLEFAIEENIRAGMTPIEARRRALAELGGLAATSERCKDLRGVAALEGIARDMRYGFRALRRTPAFATISVLSLAIGIAG